MEATGEEGGKAVEASEEPPPIASAAPLQSSAGAKAAAREPRKRKREADAAEAAKAKAAKGEAPCLVVFGLGNKGEDHAQQRHNFGARVVDALAARSATSKVPDAEAAAGVCRLEGPGRPKLLLPPQGHINSSGSALQAALAALEQPSASFLVIVDDICLPLGTIRFRAKGSSGGHNGLKSIEAIYGQDYHRLKLGIGGERSKDHVGGCFAPGSEAETAQLALDRAARAVEVWLEAGPEALQKVMATVNAPNFCNIAAPAPPAEPPAPVAAPPKEAAAAVPKAGAEAATGPVQAADSGEPEPA